MKLVYIDDVKEGGAAYFSGLMINADRWRDAMIRWSRMLDALSERRGFRRSRELHATKLLGGHGNFFAARPTLRECVDTHLDILMTIAQLPTVRIFFSCGPTQLQRRVFERMIVRVNRTMEAADDHAMLICDNGKTYDDLLNELRRQNVILGRYGAVDRPLTYWLKTSSIAIQKNRHSYKLPTHAYIPYSVKSKAFHGWRLTISPGHSRFYGQLS